MAHEASIANHQRVMVFDRSPDLRGGGTPRVMASSPSTFSYEATMDSASPVPPHAKRLAKMSSPAPEAMMAMSCAASSPQMSMMADSAPTSTPDLQSNRPSSSASTLPQQHVPTSVKLSEKGDVDFTTVPQILNCAIEEHSGGAALRSTTVKLADDWRRNRLENLLSKPKETLLHAAREIKTERNKAYDLLDALSRSGSLPIACSELHVIVSVTHCFEKDVIETVIQDNVNPVEKLELSTLLVGAAIHGVPAHRLIRDDSELLRLKGSFPVLLSDKANEE